VGTALPDGSVDFLSQSWLDYTGLSREQGMGWGWAGAIHPEDFDRVVANWRAALAAGEPVEHELRCRRADGTYHWFLNRGLPLRDDGGNVVKWYGTLTNIDALKETETLFRCESMNSLALSKQFLQCSGQRHRPEKQLISLKESLNIVGLPSKNSLIAGGRTSFIQMIDGDCEGICPGNRNWRVIQRNTPLATRRWRVPMASRDG
jgi:PAS domain S-box-containing protein